MSDLLSFWLYQCDLWPQAIGLLRSYQYHHNPIKYGDIGGLYARVSGKYFEPDENGDFLITQGVWEDQPSGTNAVEFPVLYDIIAWHPEAPDQWYFYRGETGLVLGEKAFFQASIDNHPVKLHSTPFAWLRAGCEGSVLLDHHGLNRLYGLNEVICEDVNHGTRIEQGLHMYRKREIPCISVPVQHIRN